MDGEEDQRRGRVKKNQATHGQRGRSTLLNYIIKATMGLSFDLCLEEWVFFLFLGEKFAQRNFFQKNIR